MTLDALVTPAEGLSQHSSVGTQHSVRLLPWEDYTLSADAVSQSVGDAEPFDLEPELGLPDLEQLGDEVSVEISVHSERERPGFLPESDHGGTLSVADVHTNAPSGLGIEFPKLG